MTLATNQTKRLFASMLSACQLTVVTVVSIGTFVCPPFVTGQVVQDEPDIRWHTGKIDKFNQLGISVLWSGAELRSRMTRFSRNQGLAIFLDRRIDPSTQINLSLQDVTKEQFLWTVARQNQMGVCRIEDFYYFGPIETAALMPAVYEQLRETTSQQLRKSKVDWRDRQPLKTDAVLEPKRLLLELADENQFKINNPDSIPHDIWAGFELPKTSLQARVAILLVGFGKSFSRNKEGTEIEIIDLPEIATTEATFRDLEDGARLAKALRQNFPDLRISIHGKKRLVAKGSPILIAQAQSQVVAAQKAIGDKNDKQPFELTTRTSRGNVLATAAKLTNTALVFDKANAGIAKTLNEPIEVRAKSVDELLRQALEGTNLKYEKVDDQLRITVQSP